MSRAARYWASLRSHSAILRVDCDRSKISRIETGQRGIRNRELRELLTEYGLDNPAQDVLTAIAAPRGSGAWRRAYDDQLPDVWLDVMASADLARRAYAKWGFRELGTSQFRKPVKAGLSNMVVLAKEVP